MDEITSNLSHQMMRQPLTDATNRVNNCTTPVIELHHLDRDQEMKSPDRMSIVTTPLSPKGNAEINCLTPVADSQAGSNRNSTVSSASILSGKGKRKTHVGPWQLGRTLGKGATGRVRLAKHAVTGQTAAIKIVSKKSAAMVQSESIAAMDRTAGNFGGTGARQMPCGIEREVVIMKLIEHPNVISLYDVWENRGELYLVLEYVEGGELFDYVSSNGPLPEEEAVRLFRQIIAGLGYCHRFNICHRDLKPENILLDAWHNVKLADFGMAALQPAGHWLNTSCGSPHYAAPEIIYGKKYRGDRADIWSCGIILYALLTGYLPFDGGDLPNTLRLVKKGDYFIPPELSDEAADLIQRILQKRPEDRISMQSMWTHPLLKKYEKLHQAMANHYVGPAPPLSTVDCGPPISGRQAIDVDLLRNLQTLWHDVKPELLVERLLSTEPAHERLFYNALVKFRDEQLENYQGQPLEYSASDYHHISRPPGRGKKRNMKSRVQTGSMRDSQLVMRDSSRRRNSIREPKSSGTVESYDPFRSPCNRIPDDEPKYAQITIHRLSGEPMKGSPKVSVADAGRPTNPVLREDPDEDLEECPPSSPFALLQNKKTKASSMKSFHSKISHCSSRRGINTVQTPRSISYKRNVSFRHVRSRSQGSTSVKAKQTPAKRPDRKQPSDKSLKVAIESSPIADRPASPILPAQPTVVRGSGVTIQSCSQAKKVRDSDIIWRDDARKVSHELSKICEEAFNGGSLSTACTTSTYEDSETPATSVSMATPEDSDGQIAGTKSKGRPLPVAPATPPNEFNMADLAETRRKLLEHSEKEASGTIPAHLTGVITHLDRLIEKDKKEKKEKKKKKEKPKKQEKTDNYEDRVRSLPDPFVKSSDPGYLPIISEEMVSTYGCGNDLTARQLEQRAASHVTGSTNRENKVTIRMVPHDSLRSLEIIKPLTIRKKNHTSSQQEPAEYKLDKPKNEPASRRYSSAGSRHSRHLCELDPIEESPKPPKPNEAREPNRKWSWFRHRSQPTSEESSSKTSEVKPIHPSNETVIVHEVKPKVPDQEEEKPVQNPKSSPGKKGSFLRNLIKRKPSKTVDEKSPEPEFADTNPLLKDGLSSNASSETITSQQHKPLPPRPKNLGRSQNWFARVFQIKPASRVVALNTSKVKGRKDVYKILREWKQYGMEEVYMNKANNFIYGRVGEDNFLRLKPVEFSAEFYTVLEHGRQANISLVRFKQERGAASSFNKVVDTLSMVMKQQGILVEDPVRAKKMARVLDTFPN